MNATAPSPSRIVVSLLPPLALAIGAPAFLATGGGFHNVSGLDLHYLRLPLALAGVLWLFGRLVSWAARTSIATVFVLQTAAGGRRFRVGILPVVHSLLVHSAWIALLWGLLTAVPQFPDTISNRPGGPDLMWSTKYLAAFDPLAFWSLVVLAPFAIVRAAFSAFPEVRSVLGIPVGELTILAVAFLLLSEDGILNAELSVDLSGIPPVLSLVLALNYITSVLDRAARAGLLERVAPEIVAALPVLRAVETSAVPAILLWLTLDNLPEIGDLLWYRALSRGLTETFSPLYSGLFEARNATALLAFVTILAFALPRELGNTLERYQAIASAALFSAGAYFAWDIGTSLSHLHHFYTLGGAIVASGFLTLALAQLAGYATTSSSPTLAGLGRWLSESKVRGFVLGATIAYYVLLLHPFLHQVMRFAAVFEYVAVLALMMFLLLRFRRWVRVEAEKPYRIPLDWPDWTHHEQRLAARRDPRATGMRVLESRFVDNGDWSPILSYLLGLLYRNYVPVEHAEEVCRSMRGAVLSSERRFLGGGQGRKRSIRRNTLVEVLSKVENGLNSAGQGTTVADEALLREAAGDYIQSGTNPEKLAAAMILAYSQNGSDLSAAISYWVPFLRRRAATPGWYTPPWLRTRSLVRAREQRQRMVDIGLTYLFGGDHRSSVESSPEMVAAAT
ncbi:MAG: hypothetical protein OYI31_00995 [Chloroflexota bacterium]|nr:hypothetical protein [Chloroflexota bacterium]MDE2940963.1 hypothetical protein [Chloroflexota bacterium]MDE3267025.1 hypothetical protein [Chloroflexota bacterium]